MMKKENSHLGYYISLTVLLLLGFTLASLFSFDKKLQMIIVVITVLFYVVWGILHHLINHDLSIKIVVEYILIGSLGLTAVFFLLKGGLGI